MQIKILKKNNNISVKENPFTSPLWDRSNSSVSTNYSTDKEELNAYTGNLEWVAICIDKITSFIEGAIWFWVDKNGEKINNDRVPPQLREAIDNGFYDQDFNSLISTALAYQLLTGNGYLYRAKKTAYGLAYNVVEILEPIRPDYIKPAISRDSLELYGYIVSLPNGIRLKLDPEQIIHFKQNSYINPFIGIGNITKMRLIAEGETKALDFNNEFLDNMAAPSVVVTSQEDFVQLPDYERKIEMLRAKYEGRHNRGRLMYFAGGPDSKIDVKTLQLSQKDIQFLEQKIHNRQTIISMFGCNSFIVGIPEGANRAIAQTMMIQFKETINNHLAKIEKIINKQHVWLIDKDKNINFKFKKYATGDIADIIKKINNGIITPNQGALELGDPTDDTDEVRNMYYLPSNIMPMKFLNMEEEVSQEEEKEDTNITDFKLLKDYTEYDLSNPKNVNAIATMEFKRIPHNKRFQIKYLRQALFTRNKIEDKFTYDLIRFFKQQRNRILDKFNKEFKEKKALPNKLTENIEQSVNLIFDLGFENKEFEKEIKRLHTSGVQRSISDINTITKANISFQLSNPYVKNAINRLSKHVIDGRTKAGRVVSINKTTWKDIFNVVKHGVDNDLDLIDIGDNIAKKLKKYETTDVGRISRARRIARTESRAAWDAGAEIAYNELGAETVDVIGCIGLSRQVGGNEASGDCGVQNVPIAQMSSLEFHPNHIGVIVPGKEL